MKLIDKDIVMSVIDKNLSYYKDIESRGLLSKEGDAAFRAVRILKSDINILEVKDVDMEAEYKNFVIDDPVYSKLVNNIVGKAIAKHFFELGLQARIDKELIEEINSHLDSIKDTADRMTSGNFLHHRAAIKFSANTIARVLELTGLKA